MGLKACTTRTVFIPVLQCSIAMSVEELGGRWTQSRNEFGKMNTVRKASVFFAGAEESLSFKEVPCLEQGRSGKCLCWELQC